MVSYLSPRFDNLKHFLTLLNYLVTYCGLAAYNWDGTDTTGINIPMVIISRPSTEKLWAYIEKYGNVTVQITSEGTKKSRTSLQSLKSLMYSPHVNLIGYFCASMI